MDSLLSRSALFACGFSYGWSTRRIITRFEILSARLLCKVATSDLSSILEIISVVGQNLRFLS